VSQQSDTELEIRENQGEKCPDLGLRQTCGLKALPVGLVETPMGHREDRPGEEALKPVQRTRRERTVPIEIVRERRETHLYRLGKIKGDLVLQFLAARVHSVMVLHAAQSEDTEIGRQRLTHHGTHAIRALLPNAGTPVHE